MPVFGSCFRPLARPRRATDQPRAWPAGNAGGAGFQQTRLGQHPVPNPVTSQSFACSRVRDSAWPVPCFSPPQRLATTHSQVVCSSSLMVLCSSSPSPPILKSSVMATVYDKVGSQRGERFGSSDPFADSSGDGDHKGSYRVIRSLALVIMAYVPVLVQWCSRARPVAHRSRPAATEDAHHLFKEISQRG